MSLAFGLLILASVGAIFGVTTTKYVNGRYERLSDSLVVNVDKYANATPTFEEKLQCVLLQRYLVASKEFADEPIELIAEFEGTVPGLVVTRRARKNEKAYQPSGDKPPIVVGTIRMGYGHHRLGYGTVSWAQKLLEGTDRGVLFHDILNTKSDEASVVEDAETLYSKGSQFMTSMPNALEEALAKISGSGGSLNSLRMQMHTAAHMTSTLSGFQDKETPIIATHPLVGCIAVAAGFKNVINLVVDNHAQWFCIVPGALNLIQGEKLYNDLLEMGVPKSEMQLAGHWSPRNLVELIPKRTSERIERLKDKTKPLRLLVPVGGAGAQGSLLCEIIERNSELVKSGKVELLLNAGDHEHIREAFVKQLEESNLDYDVISSAKELENFHDRLSRGEDPKKPVTLFFYDNTYAAVYTTDRLCEVADVLVVKPSELAFYSVPKLMIRRVGDHEAESAEHAAKLNDGTPEARDINEIMDNVHEFINSPQRLIGMNEAIKVNHENGIYNGCRVAVEKALAMA